MILYKGIYNYHGQMMAIYRHSKSIESVHTMFINYISEQCKINRSVVYNYFKQNRLGYKIEEVKNVR